MNLHEQPPSLQPADAPTVSVGSATKFTLTTTAVTAGIVAVGWWSSLSTVMYAATVSALSVAFLPMVLILAGLAIPFLMLALLVLTLIVAIFGAFAGAGLVAVPIGAGILEGAASGMLLTAFGARFTRTYYGWLSRIRHPVIWGTFAGFCLGPGILWGLRTWWVLPGEARTVETLVAARDLIIEQSKTNQRIPPVSNGKLLYRDIGFDLPGPVVDGFGQPLEYDVESPTFRIRSRGFDRRPGNDDFCTVGEAELSTLQKLLNFKVFGAKVAVKLKVQQGNAQLGRRWDFRNSALLIKELRCTEGEIGSPQ